MVRQRDKDVDSILEEVYTHNRAVLAAVLGLFADAIYAAHSENHAWRWMLTTRPSDNLWRFSMGYRGVEGRQAKEAVVVKWHKPRNKKIQTVERLHFIVDRQALDRCRQDIQDLHPDISVEKWTSEAGVISLDRDIVTVSISQLTYLSSLKDITAEARIATLKKYVSGDIMPHQRGSHANEVIKYMRQVLNDENITNPDSSRSHALTVEAPLQPSLFDALSSNTRVIESGDTILRHSEKDIDAYHNEEADGLPLEGRMSQVLVNRYERHPQNRAEAIRVHGTTCQVCDFVFADVYGERGEDYIEVHHKRPISSYGDAIQIDPREDMAVVCANCHRMIHRDAERPLSIESLQQIVAANRASIS